MLALSSKGVIDFEGFVRLFAGISAHIVIGDLYIQRAVRNHRFKAQGYVLPGSTFTLDRFVDLELATLSVYKRGRNECRHEQ